MAEQYCNQTLEGFLQLARYRETFFFSLCVSNFAFSLVTSLGNILVIRALLKASSIPANVKKLFLSLAFSDLGVGLVSQLMAGIIFAVILNTASKQDYNLTSLCPTVINLWLYLFFFLCAATVLTLSTTAVDRLLAASLHLRYQELVTSKRLTIVLISIWLTKFITACVAANDRHYFCRDTEHSTKRRLRLNVTLSNSYKFELSLVFSLRCISPNSHDHCVRQTSCCFAPSAISRTCHVQTCHYSIDIHMANKLYHCLDIHFPSERQ